MIIIHWVKKETMNHSDNNKSWKNRWRVLFYSAGQLVSTEEMKKLGEKNHYCATTTNTWNHKIINGFSNIFGERVFTMKKLFLKLLINHKGKNHLHNGKTDVFHLNPVIKLSISSNRAHWHYKAPDAVYF